MDRKMIVIAVIIIVIFVSAFIGLNGLSGLMSGLSGFFALFQQDGNLDIQITASISQQEFSFNSQADSIQIQAQAQDTDFYIGDQKIDLSSPVEIFIGDYEGNINLKDFSLDGNAEKILVGTIELSPKDKLIHLSTKHLGSDYIKITNVDLIPTKHIEASGYINLNHGKFFFQLEKELVKIGNFKGDLEMTEDTIKFEGKTNAVSISNGFSVDVKQ